MFSTKDYMFARSSQWLILHQNEFKSCGFVLYRSVAPTPENLTGRKYVTGLMSETFLKSENFAKVYNRQEIEEYLDSLEVLQTILGYKLKVAYVVPNNYDIESNKNVLEFKVYNGTGRDINVYASLTELCKLTNEDMNQMIEANLFGIGFGQMAPVPGEPLIQADGIEWFMDRYPELVPVRV